MTGAELKSWRERLGKDDAWIEGVLRAADIEYLGRGDKRSGYERREWIENSRGHYSERQTEQLRTGYRAALEAEEARQRAQAEPVCTEGVACWSGQGVHGGDARVGIANNGASVAVIIVRADGSMTTTPSAPLTATPALLRYAADLSEYRARKHAEGERQRKLDAVRAAEEAYLKAEDERRRAEDAADQAARALGAARREAGL